MKTDRAMTIFAGMGWITVFEEPPAPTPPTPSAPTPPTPPAPTPPTDKTFTQEEVNGLMAKEKAANSTRMNTTMQELDALKARSDLTDQERTEMESRLETIRKETLTKDQLTKEESEKTGKAHKKEVTSLQEERDTWKGLHTQSTIRNSLVTAAVAHKAFDADQIFAILQPTTKLVEKLDEDQKPTGVLVPKVSVTTKDDKGVEVVLDMDPMDAVKKMSENERHFNLFQGKGTGGTGRHPQGAPGETDLAELAKDPAAYREARKKGDVTFASI
jgi:vacuolar-type H+-ATPase subunit I/STV1